MEKKSLIIFIIISLLIFSWLFFIGNGSGQSALYGDINMIDEGQYAAWASNMLHGKIPYVDIYIQYGPLQIFPIYYAMKFFGNTIFFVRFFAIVLGTFLGIIVVLYILKYLKLNVFAQLLILFSIVIVPGIHIRQWIGILCIYCFTCVYKKQPIKRNLLTGILIAIAIFENIDTALFTFIIVILYSLFKTSFCGKKNLEIKNFLVLLCGICIPLLTIFFFFNENGWVQGYFITSYQLVTSLSGIQIPNGQGLPIISSPQSIYGIFSLMLSKQLLFYWSIVILLIFFPIQIIRILMKKTSDKDIFIFLFICFSILLYVSIVARSGHYYAMVPFVLIPMGYYLCLLTGSKLIKTKLDKSIFVLFWMFFIAYALRHIVIFRYNILSSKHNTISINLIKPLHISSRQANDIIALQKLINTNVKKNDSIYIFNNLPAYYFLLNRKNPTFYDLPLLAVSKAQRLQIISSLSKSKTRFILMDTNAWAIDGISDSERMPEVINYIKKNYSYYKKTKQYILYVRNG